MPKTAPKPPNSSASVLKTSSHKRRRWKQRNIGFVGFLGNIEQKWCRKYRIWLCCEIFVTKSKLKASLVVWRNLLPYIFQGGLQPGSPSRRATPGGDTVDIICHVTPHFFLSICIWRSFKTKCDVCNVLCEGFFMLDVINSHVHVETVFGVVSLILMFL